MSIRLPVLSMVVMCVFRVGRKSEFSSSDTEQRVIDVSTTGHWIPTAVNRSRCRIFFTFPISFLFQIDNISISLVFSFSCILIFPLLFNSASVFVTRYYTRGIQCPIAYVVELNVFWQCLQVESLQEALQSSRQDVCRLRGSEMKVTVSPGL